MVISFCLNYLNKCLIIGFFIVCYFLLNNVNIILINGIFRVEVIWVVGIIE